jgi:hypothetical protein
MSARDATHIIDRLLTEYDTAKLLHEQMMATLKAEFERKCIEVELENNRHLQGLQDDIEVAHQARVDFIVDDPSSYTDAEVEEDGALNERHICQSQQIKVHIRPCIEVKAISRFCNQYCKLTSEAHKQLQVIEGDLKEVTARKS